MKNLLKIVAILILSVSLQADWRLAGDALKASDESSGDYFGYSVDVGDDYAVIGAPHASMGGAAYVFKKDIDDKWIEMQKLEAMLTNISPSGQFNDSDDVTLGSFGADVALGEATPAIPATIVIGAPSTSVYHNNINVITGAFCVYELNTTADPMEWQQNSECMQGVVFNTEGGYESAFGTSVDISIWNEGLNSYGRMIIGDPMYDEKHSDIGLAVFFKHVSLGWQIADAAIGDGGATGADDVYFGQSVAVDKDRAVVGAPGYNILDPNDDNPDVVEIIHEVGTAYFFTSLGEEINRYTPPHEETQGGHNFGMSVDIYGDYAIVSEKHRTGGSSDSAVYIMKRGVYGNWIEHNYIENGSRGYGYSVAINDTHAAVSAFNPTASSSIYMYKKDGNGDWDTNEPFYWLDDVKDTSYGIDLALYEDELIVGAPRAEEVKQYEYVSDSSMNPAIITYLLN